MAPESDWQAESSPSGTSNFDLKRMLWGRKWLLLICAAVGAGLGYYQFTKEPEVFSSSGQVLLKRAQTAIPVEGMIEYGAKDPIDEHLELIRKGKILEGAVARLNALEEKVPTIEGLGSPERMAAVIGGRLHASRPNLKTNFIHISYTSPVQAECQPVLQAVFDSYEEYLSQDQKESSQNLIVQIEDARRVQGIDLAQKREAYRLFRASTSLLLNGEQTTNIHQERALKIENDRSLLMVQESKLKAQLNALDSAIRRGASIQALEIVAEQLKARSASAGAGAGTASSGLASMASQLLPLEVKAELLMKKLGAGHPQVQQIRSEIEIMRRLIAEENGITNNSATPRDAITIYTESLEEELRVIGEQQRTLTARFLEERTAARALDEEERLNREMADDIQRTQDLYDQIVKKLDQVSLAKANDNYSIEDISPPSVGYKTGPDQKRFLSMGGLGGLIAGLFLSFLLELSDRSFRSPGEINHFLGINVIGHIPLINSERGSKIVKDPTVDKNLAVYQRPKSHVAEAYRGVRTSLMFGLKDKSHTVIQVTSPDPGDGKSTLSANLAAALASSGKTVLLIDVDLRKPRQHTIFNYKLADGGVTCVIKGDKTIDDVAHKTSVENLWVMTAGPRVDNPGELILNPRFVEMLDAAKAKYDFVVVDTPPVLPVTDAASIAPKVDGVVLVFRITKQSKPHAMQALHGLEMVGANMLGIVVNGVGGSSGYSYGNGEYGYRFGGGIYGGYGYGDNGESRRPKQLDQRVTK